MGKMTNWQRIRGQRYLDTAQGRDVYNEQQMERGQLREKQTMTGRMILCILCGLLTFLFVYGLWCIIASFTDAMAASMATDKASSSYESGSVSSSDGTDGTSSGGGTSIDEILERHEREKAEGTSDEYEWRSKMFREANGLEGEYVGTDPDSYDQGGSTEYDSTVTVTEEEDQGTSGTDSSVDVTEGTYGGADADVDADFSQDPGFGVHIDWHRRSFNHVFFSAVAGLAVFALMYQLMKKNLAAQNSLSDMTDINQYTNDQHIALPEEIQQKYDWFPDAGAHSAVQVSSMISHMMLKNKGIKTVQFSKRYKADVVDEDGTVVYHKGDVMRDENDEVVTETVPMFDTGFATELFRASFKKKEDADAVFMDYDVRRIPYNPNNNDRDKLKGYDTVMDLINNDWEMPWYETQRPAGAYIVDTAPVNTMILAITRAGKGQTYIEPTLDMWLREKRPNNIVVNDPKGELLVKFYVAAVVRGFRVVQFNLINPLKTDIYNPLAMAANSAREGDFTKCAMYVENIADVFFPTDGGEDPVWPNAANNAFKRAAYGLIDYYMEEERTYRNDCAARIAAGEHIDSKTMDTYLDNMWGKVTLYNCYQFFVQLTSKKLANPAIEFSKKYKAGEFEGLPAEAIEEKAEEANRKAVLWNNSPETDCLTLYFNATERLPENNMRRLIANANNALKSMAGAEKMMASYDGQHIEKICGQAA